MNIVVRPATLEDAVAIEMLEREFADYLGSIGDTGPVWLDKETFLKDGFGPEPAFSTLVAETDGAIVGHVFYHPGYDIDRGGRIFQVIDLFVTENERRNGAGKALMLAVSEACRAAGGLGLQWSVFRNNRQAMAFYEKLGARYLNGMALMYLKV